MAIVVDEKIGGATLRIETKGGGYRGALIRKGHPIVPEEDDDLAALHTRLRNEAGKLHPDYVGMDGAIARFTHIFPGGFADPAYPRERTYKLAARDKLLNDLPLTRGAHADAEDALSAKRAYAATNLLSPYEKMTMKATLDSAQGAGFVRAAAALTSGNLESGLAGMTAAIQPHGRCSWPILTYLPYLWASDTHMFLKPTVTVDFATRIGHRFRVDYAPEPAAAVYESLLDLVATTERTVSPLGAQDRIDVQSFIWVVGAYSEVDKAVVDQERAALAG